MGRKLRALRVEKGLEQRDVGAWNETVAGRRKKIRHENSGVSLGTYQMIEKGEGREVRDSNIERIARFLGTTLDALRRDPEIRPNDPRLQHLNDESLKVARQYLYASSAVRARVRQLLQQGEADLAIRLGRLPAPYGEQIRALVIEAEALQPARATTGTRSTQS